MSNQLEHLKTMEVLSNILELRKKAAATENKQECMRICEEIEKLEYSLMNAPILYKNEYWRINNIGDDSITLARDVYEPIYLPDGDVRYIEEDFIDVNINYFFKIL